MSQSFRDATRRQLRGVLGIGRRWESAMQEQENCDLSYTKVYSIPYLQFYGSDWENLSHL